MEKEESKITLPPTKSHKRSRNAQDKTSGLKKPKIEESVPIFDHPMIPFSELLENFIAENKTFLATLRCENQALMLKNSRDGLFGNYTGYYKKRLLNYWSDPRIDLIKEKYIKDKKCLDIGCNEGQFTILLAKKYKPLQIIGCDIDFSLIFKAVQNLHNISHNNNEDISKLAKFQELYKKVEKLPLYYQILLKEITDPAIKNILSKKQIMFRQENFIAEFPGYEKFDTIFCMSTAKWIHLHYGDTGIKTLFYKIHSELNENGYFIFENENWASYKKKKYLSPVMKENYKKIKLYPQYFEAYLCGTFGLKLVEKIQVQSEKVKVGYNREILIFQKSK